MMRVLFSVFTAIVFLLVCVVFSRSSGALQGDTNFYLGQAATRSYFPTSLDKTNFYANARSVHYARNDLTSCQLAFTDSHISNGGPLPGEVAAGADTSIKVGRMWAASIVKVQVAADRTARLADAVVGLQIHLLIFDGAPQPLDEDIVPPSPFAVHADGECRWRRAHQ